MSTVKIKINHHHLISRVDELPKNEPVVSEEQFIQSVKRGEYRAKVPSTNYSSLMWAEVSSENEQAIKQILLLRWLTRKIQVLLCYLIPLAFAYLAYTCWDSGWTNPLFVIPAIVATFYLAMSGYNAVQRDDFLGMAITTVLVFVTALSVYGVLNNMNIATVRLKNIQSAVIESPSYPQKTQLLTLLKKGNHISVWEYLTAMSDYNKYRRHVENERVLSKSKKILDSLKIE